MIAGAKRVEIYVKGSGKGTGAERRAPHSLPQRKKKGINPADRGRKPRAAKRARTPEPEVRAAPKTRRRRRWERCSLIKSIARRPSSSKGKEACCASKREKILRGYSGVHQEAKSPGLVKDPRVSIPYTDGKLKKGKEGSLL